MINIGFMASHGGSGMKAVLEAIEAGLQADPRVCIGNNRAAEAFNVARTHGLARYYLSSVNYPHDTSLDRAICSALQAHAVDLLLLSGYMKKLGPQTLAAFKNRILNIHPSLLPKYGGAGMYGDRVHQAVVDQGEAESGATVHLVNEEYDQGPILKQAAVKLDHPLTLTDVREKVRAVEGPLYVATLADIIAGRIVLPDKNGL